MKTAASGEPGPSASELLGTFLRSVDELEQTASRVDREPLPPYVREAIQRGLEAGHRIAEAERRRAWWRRLVARIRERVSGSSGS